MNLRHDPNVLAFVQSAREFCALVETPPPDKVFWQRALTTALAKFYAAAHRLPEPALDNVDESANAIADDEWRVVYKRLNQMLGANDYYWGFPSNFGYKDSPNGPPAPALGSLADDLTNIYRDVAGGVRAWDSGDADYATIVYQWKDRFTALWGMRALNALRMLQQCRS